MTHQAAQAAGAEAARSRCSHEHESRAERRPAADHRRPRSRRRLQLADHPRRRARRRRARRARACSSAWYATGRRGVSSLDLPRPRAQRQLHRLHRPPRLRRRARDRRRPDDRLRRRAARPRGDPLQRLRLAAHPARHARDAAAALAARRSPARSEDGEPRSERRRERPARARRVRARPRGDPQAARARLRRDLDLPRAGRVDRRLLRRADDRDAQRLGERRGRSSPTTRCR